MDEVTHFKGKKATNSTQAQRFRINRSNGEDKENILPLRNIFNDSKITILITPFANFREQFGKDQYRQIWHLKVENTKEIEKFPTLKEAMIKAVSYLKRGLADEILVNKTGKFTSANTVYEVYTLNIDEPQLVGIVEDPSIEVEFAI